ncbi:flagellar hook-associated protein [Exiguobacterium sp. SH3S2]|uniref:flagellar filament capping protein FliD n=1 Tax=unclassified Exiguobacterium TaxID=2644629 RepID=UPI00104080E2|nr:MULTISPECIES: flagellar filament capping protein FliD [unclassified Exiguobacterium]TCI41548.1 flagellar hook-associated protein [Exiguobacterium sp. SH3S3]TCI58186.1 flagellar hook-associated protein [Exiguobacterium sp. SH3S2]
MTTPIRFGGLASGIDTDTIIKQLMQVERAPVDKLEQKKQTTEWKRDAYREINRSLMSLRNSAVDLIFTRNYYAKTATSSDDARVSVVAGPSSGNAAIRIDSVDQLATSASTVVRPLDKNDQQISTSTKISDLKGLVAGQKRVHQNADGKEMVLATGLNFNDVVLKDENGDPLVNADFEYDSATGKLTATNTTKYADGIIPEGVVAEYTQGTAYEFRFRSSTTGPMKKIDLAADATVQDLLNQINGKDTGLSAFFEPVSGKLSISTKETGQAATIDFDAESRSALNMSDAPTGTDAKFTINGIEVTRSSNTTTIDNMTITLKAEFPTPQNPTAGPVTLSAATDTQKVFDNIKGFVDKYNETIDLMNKKVREDKFRTFTPLTKAQRDELSEDEIKKWEEKAMSGMLRGDNILRGTMDTLRSRWSSTTSATADKEMDFLFQIGLSTGKDVSSGGKIELNEEKLKAAIEKDPEQVYKLFTNAETGLLPQLRDAAAASRETISRIAGVDGSGSQSHSMGKEMTAIDARIKRLNDLLVNKENAYYRRFTAMETAMNQANSQAASLQQFLGGGM